MNPSIKTLWSLAIVSLAFLNGDSTRSRAGEWSAKDLIALAPVITSSDERYRSIEVDGSVRWEGHANLVFRATYRAPDRYSILICDGNDGAPMLYSADRKLLVYDPVRSCVMYSEEAAARLFLWQKTDNIQFHWNVSMNTKKSSKIFIDVRSLFAETAKNQAAVEDAALKLDEMLFDVRALVGERAKEQKAFKDEILSLNRTEYRLARTFASGGNIIASIDLAKPCGYTRVELFSEAAGLEPFICLNHIVVNGNVNDEAFAFPDKKRLEETIKVRDHTGDKALDEVGSMAHALRAMFVRAAAKQPEMRKSLPFPGLVGIDWDQVNRNDAKYAPALRALLPSMPEKR